MVSILLFTGGIREWQIESASVNWPATQAEIMRSEVVKRFYAPTRSEIAFAVYDRKISVRYAVNGVEYSNDFNVPADPPNTPSPKRSEGMLSSKTGIEQITLHYDPSNPREAVLHPGDRALAVRGMAIGGIGTVVFSLFILYLVSFLSKPGANG